MCLHNLLQIRRDIGEDGPLVDVGVIFGVDVFQFRMERCIAGAGQAAYPSATLVQGSPLWKLV